MTEQAIVVSNNNIIRSVDDASRVAKAMAMSEYFSDAKDVAKAMVKVMAGHELGVGAFASMTGIHIIKGKPTMGGNLIASLIKNDPRYNYRVKKHDETVCEIEFIEDGEVCGVSSFSMEDAKRAGLLSNQTWNKYPKNMLFARAISNGARWHTPGIFGGAPVYTPEELGAEVDEDGEVIEGVVVDDEPENGNGHKPEKPSNHMPEKQVMSYETASKVKDSEGNLYIDKTNEELSNMSIGIGKALNKPDLTQDQRDTYQMKQDAISTILTVRNRSK